MAEVDVPEPFSIEALCENVARRRGRPIELRAFYESDPTMPCGLWLQMPERDVIYYEGAVSLPLRENIIAHELGHILADHPCDQQELDVYRARLMPTLALNPSLLTRVLGRVSYTTAREQEAEMFAWLLLGSVRSPDAAEARGDASAQGRAAALLGPSS
ncbi:hypothetical protein WDV85_16740 [Pseudokineococcus sp. 5B2Z-1]|uniref:hypothetical protein n=1 Tax=Pseudokineococcus sp. 5B2Z-1 TaxID=3132744 RepID=UPI0030B5A507